MTRTLVRFDRGHSVLSPALVPVEAWLYSVLEPHTWDYVFETNSPDGLWVNGIAFDNDNDAIVVKLKFPL